MSNQLHDPKGFKGFSLKEIEEIEAREPDTTDARGVAPSDSPRCEPKPVGLTKGSRKRNKSSRTLKDARLFLLGYLRDQNARVDETITRAKELDISERTLRTAKKEVGVASIHGIENGQRVYRWTLPDTDSAVDDVRLRIGKFNETVEGLRRRRTEIIRKEDSLKSERLRIDDLLKNMGAGEPAYETF
jgi:hypothetical protein